MPQVFADAVADHRRVLTHARGEDQPVHAAESRRHGADRLLDPVDVHVDGKAGTRLVPFRRGQDLAHVGRDARHPQQARVVIERVVELIGG